MKRIFISSLVILIFHLSLSLSAQEITIKGTITSSDDGTGLPGASVQIKGTQMGVVASSDGSYEITANSNAVLIFSFIGYEPQEIPVENRTIIDVTLKLSPA